MTLNVDAYCSVGWTFMSVAWPGHAVTATLTGLRNLQSLGCVFGLDSDMNVQAA